MAWIRKRPGRAKPYEARWRDPGGRERSPSVDRELDAQRFLATVEADSCGVRTSIRTLAR